MGKEKDNNKDEGKEQQPCCSDPSCCGPEGQDDSKSSASCCGPDVSDSGKTGMKTIKSLVFFLVIFAAIGMAGRSVINKNKDENCVVDERVLCGVNIQSVRSLNTLAAEKDFIFMLIPGEDRDALVDVSVIVDRVSKKISEQGTRVGIFNLEKGNEDYDKIVKFNKINSYPAVLAMGKGMGSMVIQGEITEEKLMEGYTVASKPAFCAPGGKCCP